MIPADIFCPLYTLHGTNQVLNFKIIYLITHKVKKK